MTTVAFIGLGIMGLADVMYKIGVRYGDRESLDLAGQVMEFVRFHCMKTSIELAQARRVHHSGQLKARHRRWCKRQRRLLAHPHRLGAGQQRLAPARD